MSDTTARPDPFTEIRMTSLRTLRGINYWSRRPVTRMDMTIGAYDAISSAEVQGFTEALVSAMPGLVEHRCSIGERGGFIVRLRRGTYAAHVVEHVALELQLMIGHEVGYGRTRGADAPGAYTLVFEHEHEAVGRRAAVRALEIVRLAFAGTLHSVDRQVAELAELAQRPTWKPAPRRVLCGITGGDDASRAATQRLLCHRLASAHLEGCAADENDLLANVEDLAPSTILAQGVPYTRSRVSVILDADLHDIPERFSGRECAVRLVSTVADAVEREGVVVCHAKDWDIQEYARDRGRHVAVFSVDDDAGPEDLESASIVGIVRDGRIRIENAGAVHDAGALITDVPVEAQLGAALAAHALAGYARLHDAQSNAANGAPSNASSKLDVAPSQSH